MSCLQTPGPRPATRRGPCRPPARCSPGASSTSEGAGRGGGRGSRAQVGMVHPDGRRVEPWWPRAPDAPTARPLRAPPARAARTPLRAARSPTRHRDGGRIAEGASPASAPCRPPDHRNCSARPRAQLRGGLPAPSSSLQRGLRAGGRSLATRASPPSSRTYSPLGVRDGHRPRARACQAPPVRTPALGISCGNREPRRAWRRSPARPVTSGRSKPHCKKVMFAPFSRRGTALPSSQTHSGGH